MSTKLFELSLEANPDFLKLLSGDQSSQALPYLLCGFVVWLVITNGKK